MTNHPIENQGGKLPARPGPAWMGVGLTASIWTGHLLINILSSQASAAYATLGHQMARVLVAILGFALSLAIQFFVPAGDDRKLRSRLLLQFLLFFIASAIVTYHSYVLADWLTGGNQTPKNYWAYNQAYYLWIFLTCGALNIGLAAHQRMLREVRRAAEIEGKAHQAQLLALRYQLNPHFFFNVLNTLSGLLTKHRLADAERIIINMADFLRYTLSESPTELVTVRAEVEAQRNYLEIEKVRFDSRLIVEVDVAADCAAARLPSLILQPLVENVVKHAVGQSDASILLRISARREGDRLVCSIENSAVPDPLPAIGGLGVGLRNVSQRLQAVYGADARLESGPLPDGSWRSLVSVPFETRDDENPDR